MNNNLFNPLGLPRIKKECVVIRYFETNIHIGYEMEKINRGI